MNKLVAFALLGSCLAFSVGACSDDDDVIVSGAGTSAGGTSAGTAGKAAGGMAQAGTSNGGTAAGTGGKGGSAGNGGTNTAGTAGKGGTTSGGAGGADAGAPSEGGMGGADADMGGAGGMGAGGEAGAPPVELVPATDFWLNQYCLARSSELLMCAGSPTWSGCYAVNDPYLSVNAAEVCPAETDMDNFPLTVAVLDAFDQLASTCPAPDVSQMRCNIGTDLPEFRSKACRDADAARLAASQACGL